MVEIQYTIVHEYMLYINAELQLALFRPAEIQAIRKKFRLLFQLLHKGHACSIEIRISSDKLIYLFVCVSLRLDLTSVITGSIWNVHSADFREQ